MSALLCWQGLEAIYRQIPGIRTVLLGSPSGDMDLPGLYTAYESFERPLRNSPPARNQTGMRHAFVTRLVIRWVDFQAAEMELIALLDAIPDAIDADLHLGGRLNAGAAYCPSGIAGFANIGGTDYRVVDYQVTVLQKVGT